MKILVISTVNYGVNGITKVIMNNYKYINKNQYQMDFLFPNKPDNETIKYMNDNSSKMFIIPNRSKKVVKYIRELDNLLRNKKYDIIHVHGNSTTLGIEMAVAKKNNIEVRVPHAHNTFTKFPIINKLLRPFFENTYTEGFACSDAAGKWLFRDNPYFLIKNGINVDEYKFDLRKRNKTRIALNYQEDDIVIGNVGRLSKEKNQTYLIYLLKELLEKDSRFRLLLIGDGDLKEEYEILVKRLGITNYVTFTGNVENVNEYLMAMDMFISSSFNEGLPLSLIEAQATDLQCLITNNVDEAVNVSEKVLFFDLDNKSYLIKLITSFLSNRNDRTELTMFNKIKNSEYNIKNSVSYMEQLYNSF